MFYANNEQVKGIFLNGRNYNYLAYGFGKIVPEDRNVEQLNLNLAGKYLNKYRIEFGTVKDGYENALVSPRMDKPDSNGVFHTPFTYYYGGNIISTKEVPVLITNGSFALSNALVYNDMNINGAINYFAINTDFQGHNVNTYLEGFGSSQSYFDSTVMSNCSNFHLRSLSRFSKGYQPTLYNCNNFSGWFNFVRGDDGTRYPGFRGFLEGCKDGVFNINCTNMHGGGSNANVRNYYNFSGIQSCNNIRLNIIGSSWQVWPHNHSFTSNCNINTYNVISGFSYMNDCNFNVVLPKDSKPEMDKPFEFLNNVNNCNYNLNALDSNLFNYRSGVGHNLFFDRLNNCNLNLLVNNTVSFDHSFGGNFSHCNIVFDNIKADFSTYPGWGYLYNCNISGNVEATGSPQELIGFSDGVNVNINAAKSSRIQFLWRSHNVRGNFVAGDTSYITYGSYVNLNVYRGRLCFNSINNSYFRVNNTTFNCRRVNDTEIYSDGGNTSVTGLDNCYNLTLSGLTFNTTALGDSCLLVNVYNSNIGFGTANTYYRLWRVENCDIDGFPRSISYVKNCIFRPFSLETVGLYGGVAGTWNNMWPHNTIAGIRSMDNISNCRIEAEVWNLDGSTYFNNVNNMQTSVGAYYNGTVTANLPIYNMEIKFNVDCNTLNLGIFQGGPPHGFVNSCISANTIYAKNTSEYYVQLSNGARLYCKDYCDVPFSLRGYGSNDPVMLINNYKIYNSGCSFFDGGLTRIGGLKYQGGAPFRPTLNNGACLFINNTLLDGAFVNNSLLFVGSNVTWTSSTKITIGNGLIVNKANWRDYEGDVLGHINGKVFAWNIWDSGPWGSQSLFDYCINV